MGVSSRRKAEELIIEGRVTVNGSIASIGMKADASKDHIKLDGKLIKKAEPHIYLMFNKPRGVLTSMSDPEGRPTISDYLKGVRFRVFPIGRLDYDSEGLLLLTNDGDLSHAVLHPSRKIPKTYVVKVKNVLMDEKLALLRDGIRLEDGITAPAGVKRIKNTENNSWIEMTIYEGRKRQIRRMLEKLGHPVMRLRRIAVNGLKLMGLEPGQLRTLTAEELETLKREVLS